MHLIKKKNSNASFDSDGAGLLMVRWDIRGLIAGFNYGLGEKKKGIIHHKRPTSIHSHTRLTNVSSKVKVCMGYGKYQKNLDLSALKFLASSWSFSFRSVPWCHLNSAAQLSSLEIRSNSRSWDRNTFEGCIPMGAVCNKQGLQKGILRYGKISW